MLGVGTSILTVLPPLQPGPGLWARLLQGGSVWEDMEYRSVWFCFLLL